jgi:hypothetical protein
LREVLARIESQAATFRGLPLYTFMADRTVPPELRLPHCYHIAHFLLSFSDLCRLVLQSKPTTDPIQEGINRNAEEDMDHWQWYLRDLVTLGLDREMRFSEALQIVWSRETEKSRLLTYRLCHLGIGASSLQKLVLLLCIEAPAVVGMESTTKVAREVTDRIGTPLVYFGSHHLDAEEGHTLRAEDQQQSFREIRLDPETRQGLFRVVDQSFDAFTDFVNEIFEYLSARARGK